MYKYKVKKKRFYKSIFKNACCKIISLNKKNIYSEKIILRKLFSKKLIKNF